MIVTCHTVRQQCIMGACILVRSRMTQHALQESLVMSRRSQCREYAQSDLTAKRRKRRGGGDAQVNFLPISIK